MQQDARANSKTAETDKLEFRAECYRCFRAQSVCICDRVPNIQNKTGIIVLQHHREVLHPIGTARIARLSLQNVDVRIAHRVNQLKVNPVVPASTALLYPRPDARNLDEVDSAEFPDHLIVLDGTWAQANAMYRANVWLHHLPHLVIRPETESNYRIRKQPKQGCLSTIEALVHTMQLMEPNTERLEDLLSVFNSMVDDQLRFIDSA